MSFPGTGASAGYRFHDVELDLRRRELRVDGVPAAVEPRVYALLVLLIEGRDRAFGKDELIARLWGDRPVSDASLSQLVYKARRVLREDAARRCIETVHGHGFRWLAAVQTLDAEPEEAPPTAPSPPAHDAPIDAPQASPLAAPAGAAAPRPVPAPAVRPRRRARTAWLVAAAAALLLAAALGLWRHAPAADPATRAVLLLPVIDDTGDAALGWTQRGLPGLLASVLDQADGVRSTEAGAAAAVGPEALRDPAQRRRLRLAAGADAVALLRLSRAGTLLRLDLRLEGDAPPREDTLFGPEAAPLGLDAARRIATWLGGGRAVAPGPVAGMDGYLAETYARGIEAFLDGRIDSARHHFSICAERRPDLVWPRLQLAAVELRLGRQEDAMARLAALERDADAMAPVPARFLRLRLAEARLQGGDAAAAARAFAALRAEAEAIDDDVFLRLVLSGLGRAEAAAGRVDAALAPLQRVLDLDRRHGDTRREALALADLAVLALLRGDLAGADSGLLQALDLARRLDLPAAELRALLNLASVQQARGRLAAAHALFAQALPLAQRQGDVAAQARAHVGLATAQAAHGLVAPAQRHVDRALQLVRRHGLREEEVLALAAAAGTAEARDEPEAALTLRTEALQQALALGNAPQVAWQRLGLVRLAQERGRPDLVAPQLDAARRLAEAADARAEVRAFSLLTQAWGARPLRGPALPDERLPGQWRRAVAVESLRLALAAGEAGQGAALLRQWEGAEDDAVLLALRAHRLDAEGRGAEATALRARIAALGATLADPADAEKSPDGPEA